MSTFMLDLNQASIPIYIKTTYPLLIKILHFGIHRTPHLFVTNHHTPVKTKVRLGRKKKTMRCYYPYLLILVDHSGGDLLGACWRSCQICDCKTLRSLPRVLHGGERRLLLRRDGQTDGDGSLGELKWPPPAGGEWGQRAMGILAMAVEFTFLTPVSLSLSFRWAALNWLTSCSCIRRVFWSSAKDRCDSCLPKP